MSSISTRRKTVIVTGGTGGFGEGIAEAFIAADARVWITGRNKVKLAETAARIGANAFVADVADPSAWDRLRDEVLRTTGRLDVLINNAGEGVKVAPTTEQTDATIMQSIASNMTGAILGCRRAAAIMQRQGSGLIVNIGSACSTHAWPNWATYSAAKAGLLMFSRCLLAEMRPFGVKITSVLPSWGQTDFTSHAGLPPREAEVLAQCITPMELGRLLVDLAHQPEHLVTEEIKLWPMVQPIAQL